MHKTTRVYNSNKAHVWIDGVSHIYGKVDVITHHNGTFCGPRYSVLLNGHEVYGDNSHELNEAAAKYTQSFGRREVRNFQSVVYSKYDAADVTEHTPQTESSTESVMVVVAGEEFHASSVHEAWSKAADYVAAQCKSSAAMQRVCMAYPDATLVTNYTDSALGFHISSYAITLGNTVIADCISADKMWEAADRFIAEGLDQEMVMSLVKGMAPDAHCKCADDPRCYIIVASGKCIAEESTPPEAWRAAYRFLKVESAQQESGTRISTFGDNDYVKSLAELNEIVGASIGESEFEFTVDEPVTRFQHAQNRAQELCSAISSTLDHIGTPESDYEAAGAMLHSFVDELSDRVFECISYPDPPAERDAEVDFAAEVSKAIAFGIQSDTVEDKQTALETILKFLDNETYLQYKESK